MLSNVADLTDVLTAMIHDGHTVTAEFVSRLSPYVRDHIRRLGRFVLDMDQIPAPLTRRPFHSKHPRDTFYTTYPR